MWGPQALSPSAPASAEVKDAPAEVKDAPAELLDAPVAAKGAQTVRIPAVKGRQKMGLLAFRLEIHRVSAADFGTSSTPLCIHWHNYTYSNKPRGNLSCSFSSHSCALSSDCILQLFHCEPALQLV